MLNKYIIPLVLGFIGGLLAINLQSKAPTNEERINDFYQTETAVHVSPHHIRKAIAKNDDSFILVDLRSQEEYEKEHVVGAINIPAYKDPNTSDYTAVDRITGEFAKLPKEKDIVVYCYSIPCMTGRKIGKMLADNNIFVQLLGVGWNEWRYYWNLWNHEHEIDTVQVEDYVTSGPEPGTYSGPPLNTLSPCTTDEEFGC